MEDQATDSLRLQLRSMLELSDGWDGQDAPAPKVSAIEWVRDFVTDMAPERAQRFAVCPTHEGGVLVEQQTEHGRWSLEVGPTGEVVVITVPTSGEPSLVEIETPAEAIDLLPPRS